MGAGRPRLYEVLYDGEMKTTKPKVTEQELVDDAFAVTFDDNGYDNPIVRGSDGEFYTLVPLFHFGKADPAYVADIARQMYVCVKHWRKHCKKCGVKPRRPVSGDPHPKPSAKARR